MTARIPCRSSSSNAANTLTKVNIRIQFLLVYGKWNRMSLISGNAEFKKSFVLPNPDGQQTKKS